MKEREHSLALDSPAMFLTAMYAMRAGFCYQTASQVFNHVTSLAFASDATKCMQFLTSSRGGLVPEGLH